MDKPKLIRITTVPISLNLLLKNQLKFLSKYFNVVALSSPGRDLEVVRERENVRVHAIKIEREINIFNDLLSFFKIVLFLKAENPQIIHSNTPKSSLLSMLAGKLIGVKYRVYTITGLRYEGVSGFKRKFLIIFEKLTCLFATHVICESKGVYKKVKIENISNKEPYLLANGNINGVDTSFFSRESVDINVINDLKLKCNFTTNDFIFIFIGRITRDKGVFELLEAFDKINSDFKNIKLLFVGPFDQSKELENKFRLNENIIYFDFQEDVRPYLALSQCLVLPSYREGFPNVILEAGSMSLPVIMTKVNGHHEFINKKNGLVIETRNVDQLYKAMLNTFLNYSQFDRTYCRNFVVSKFDQTIVHDALLKFYKKLFKNV